MLSGGAEDLPTVGEDKSPLMGSGDSCSRKVGSRAHDSSVRGQAGRAGAKGFLLMHLDLLPQAFSVRLLGIGPHVDGSRDVRGASVLGLSQKKDIMRAYRVGVNPVDVGPWQRRG